MRIETPDDFDGKAIEMRDGGFQFLSGIAAIGEDLGKRRVCIPTALDEVRRAIAVLNVGRMD